MVHLVEFQVDNIPSKENGHVIIQFFSKLNRVKVL